VAIHEILTYPDARLKTRAAPVGKITPDIIALVESMKETMYAEGGIGLAAPQIGVPVRVFIVEVAGVLKVFVDPRFTGRSGEAMMDEGCLSFPGIHGRVKRSSQVTVESLGLDGKNVVTFASGLLAVAIQHEYDHLEGILFTDRMGPLERRMVMRKIG
jgi:peptide deformylase